MTAAAATTARVQLAYILIGTTQSFTTYPRTYTDNISATARTRATFSGIAASANSSALFITYAKVVGDVNGDGRVDIIDAGMAAYAFGSHLGDNRYDASIDLNADGYIGITDVSIVFYNHGNHA